MTIDDRCRISGDGPTIIGSGGPLEVKIDDTLFSVIESYDDVTLRDRSIVNGNIFTAGYVDRINNPVVNGYVREEMIVEPHTISTSSVTPGTTDRTAFSGQTLDLSPGNFRDIVLHGNSMLLLHNGTYQFRKIIAYAGARIRLDAPGGEIMVRVAEEVNLGDRTIMEPVSGYLNPLDIQWYSNQSSTVYLGTVCQLIGVFTTPHAGIRIGSRTVLKGRVLAETITLDPDVKVESVNDTRYADSDFDDVPDIVETEMGTNPYNRSSTPKVAQPSSWYGDASQDMVVYYDLSMFPKYFSHTHVPVTIPAGVNDRAYNPIFSILEPEDIGVPLALPPGNVLEAAYYIKAGIAPETTLLLGFPLPGASSIDIQYGNVDNYLLQHYNDSSGIWETIPIDYVDDNVAYASVSSNQTFALSDVPVGLNTINNLRVCVDDDGAAVVEEKNYANPVNDIVITDAQRLEKVVYSFDQFRTIIPQMRYSFVPTPPTAATTDLRLRWVENATILCNEDCRALNYWIAGVSFLQGSWHLVPNYNQPACPGGADDDNTILFNPYNFHYSLHGTDFIAREEIFDEWNRNLREEVYRRELINDRGVTNRVTGAALDPENDVFHPAGNQLTGADLTWVIRHELGHCFGLGGDNDHGNYIDAAGISGVDPTPDNSCPACECITHNLCRPMIDEWEGLICYESGFPICGKYYNNNMMREFDARDMVANTDLVVSYPYIRKFVRMRNRDGARYITNNWYDVRYRMLETSFAIGAADNNPERFFVMGLDSVMVSLVAGSPGVSGDFDGPGLSARLDQPCALLIDDTNGDVYFGVNGKIKILSAQGVVSTFAGTGVPGYANGPRLNAQFAGVFNAPFCRDGAGNIYVCERDVNRIRRIDAAGMVTLFAGSDLGDAGYINGNGAAARFNHPSSMCVDAAGNVYVADQDNHVIRRITPAGDVSTFAGTGGPGNFDGTVATAEFNQPCGIAIDPATGNLYVSERSNYCVRLIDMSVAPPTVTRFAGTGVSGFADGEALTARFGVASDLFVDTRGIVYVADASNNAIRKIHNGFVSTLAGRPGDPVLFRDGCGTDARFNEPNDVIADTKGNLFVTEVDNHTLRKISTHVPLTVNAPLTGARVEDGDDAVWFEFTVTGNLDHTITVTPDALLLGSGAVPVPAPNTVGVDAELFGPDNEYLPVLNGAETDGDGVSIVKNAATGRLATGRYLLRVYAHNPAYASGAFSVRVANTRQDVAVPAVAGASSTVDGNLEHEGDNDWFRIDVTAAVTLTIETENRSAGLVTEPVIYMYRDSEGLPVAGVPRVSTPHGVVAVPGVTEDDVDANNRIPLIRRILRDGRGQISQVEFGPIQRDDNRVNGFDIYWIRVRAGNQLETGTYTLRVTRN